MHSEGHGKNEFVVSGKFANTTSAHSNVITVVFLAANGSKFIPGGDMFFALTAAERGGGEFMEVEGFSFDEGDYFSDNFGVKVGADGVAPIAPEDMNSEFAAWVFVRIPSDIDTDIIAKSNAE